MKHNGSLCARWIQSICDAGLFLLFFFFFERNWKKVKKKKLDKALKRNLEAQKAKLEKKPESQTTNINNEQEIEDNSIEDESNDNLE